MGKTAFIFPGQGAQVCGMGQDFYENSETAKAVFDRATELLGFSVPELCFEKNDRLDITEYTQAAMVTTSVAMMKVMEERGIQQWNHPGYLRRYPLDYFRQCAEEGQLYALWTECGALAAGAVVLEEDPRWTGYGGKALYVHNLAASLHFSGAGTELLRRCLALAAERGQDYLRLDCARDNPVLHDYYERFGFRFVAPVEDQGYLGDLLQYPLGSRD